MSTKIRLLALTGLVAAIAVVAGACSGSESKSTPEEAPPTAVAQPLAESAPAPAASAPAAPTQQPSAEPEPVDAAAAPAIEEQLQQLLDNAVGDGIPGAIVDVDSPLLDIAWGGSAGSSSLESGEPLRPEHAFRTASITKMVTAATVLRLVEEGVLGLDDLISAHLPPKLVARVHVLDGTSRGAEITVRQLLAHTAGLYHYVSDDGFVDTVLADPTAAWTPRQLIDYALENGEPYFEPGQGYHYSDTGYVLLGLIVERATGEPLHETYQELVFEPLGMDSTYQEGYEDPRGAELSHPYFEDVDAIVVNGTVDWASGGLVSTAADLRRFVRGVLEGDLYERPDTLGTMLELTPGLGGPGFRFSYGLGVQVLEAGELELRGHDGFWGSFMWYWPELDATITGTINQAEADQFELVGAVAEVLTQHAGRLSQGTP